jgi:hypothetical protein
MQLRTVPGTYCGLVRRVAMSEVEDRADMPRATSNRSILTLSGPRIATLVPGRR